jgi:3-oxoacyl-[acyl-carrier protein] reductase
MVPEDGPMADMVSAMTAVGRFAQPREIGSLVSSLASNDTGFVTGATLNIDGGMSI